MKTYIELGLAALLAVLVYEKPNFLVSIVNTTLGKVVVIVIVGLLAKQYGLNAGLLAAIIMILLLDSNREGYDNPVKIPLTIGANCNEQCQKSKDCAACKASCPGKSDPNTGLSKPCACQSTCENGKCKCGCEEGECVASGDPNAPTEEDVKLHGSGAIERYSNINASLQPSSFPVTGTDQIGLSRMLKVNAINATMAASQQANGCTNNGGGIAF